MVIKVPQDAIYSTGSRKSARARVWIWRGGDGKIWVNRMSLEEYFRGTFYDKIALQALDVTQRRGIYTVFATLAGGGASAQAQALRHGIARALQTVESELKPVLRAYGFLTRDARKVERKKYGRRKARKRQQWKKR